MAAMATLPTVLVTGATGCLGRAAVASLVKSGRVNVRVAVADPRKSGDFMKMLGAHEVVEWDVAKRKTWANAMDGVSRVLSSAEADLAQPNGEWARYLETRMVMVAGKESVEHVVSIGTKQALSLRGGESAEELQQLWEHSDVPVAEGLPLTAISGNFSANPFLEEAPASRRDVAEEATKCLLEGPEMHAYQTYDINGKSPAARRAEREGMDVATESKNASAFDILEAKASALRSSAEEPHKDVEAVKAMFKTYLSTGLYTPQSMLQDVKPKQEAVLDSSSTQVRPRSSAFGELASE